jgi:hypothetical protein
LATDVAEDASLDDRLHLSDAIGRQVMGLAKLDLAVVGLARDAVEDDEVAMRVDVERRAGTAARVIRRLPRTVSPFSFRQHLSKT